MIIQNVKIITPFRLIKGGSVRVSDGMIAEVSQEHLSDDDQIIDGKGLYIAPGFIDLHLHGGAGCDFMNGDVQDSVNICKLHLSHGTTGMYPTSISSSDEDLFAFIDMYKQLLHIKQLPDLYGIHLEGPYFSNSQKGAQDAKYICVPNPDVYRKIITYGEGHIKRWSIAPELPGACDMAVFLKNNGILPSIAHSDADYEDVVIAAEYGYSHMTHFYSAMTGVHRRHAYRYAGAVEAGYGLDELTVEIIADGKHLPPALLKLICSSKGTDKVALVTDASMGAGMPDGEYLLGSKENGQKIFVEDGVAFVADRSAFAGSVATADLLVRNMIQLADCSVCDAVKMMTLTPARIMGISHIVGSIAPGKRANLVLFDEDVQVSMVIVGGEICFRR